MALAAPGTCNITKMSAVAYKNSNCKVKNAAAIKRVANANKKRAKMMDSKCHKYGKKGYSVKFTCGGDMTIQRFKNAKCDGKAFRTVKFVFGKCQKRGKGGIIVTMKK